MPLSIAETGGFVLEFVYEWEKSGNKPYCRHLGSTVQELQKRGTSATMGGTMRKELRNGRLLKVKF